MTEHLSDPDGETLKFDISITDKTILHINPAGNILHATTLGYGVTDVVIVASDSRGLKCTLPFKLRIKLMLSRFLNYLALALDVVVILHIAPNVIYVVNAYLLEFLLKNFK